MGGCGFNTVGYGKTPNEAFRRAVDEAKWESGYGGYTGTIAEKHEFVLFPLPAGVKAQELHEATVSLSYSTSVFTSRTPDAVAWRKTPVGARMTRLYRKWVKNPELMALVKRVRDVYDDKWGPAVAVELTGKAAADARLRATSTWLNGLPRGTKFFLFFGVASS